MSTIKFLTWLFLLWGHSVFSQTFYTGVDLSYVNEMEDCGTTYMDQAGASADPYQLLTDEGANLVRLRLWHNPQWTAYSNFDDVQKSIKRAQESGSEVLLNFHYSDFWADPGRQWRPAAWEAVTDDTILADSVYHYTYRVLKQLHETGNLPEMVQIGNETNPNILIARNDRAISSNTPDDELWEINWPRQVQLLQSGINAVKDLNAALQTTMRTVIHIANPSNGDWWFDNAIQNGLTDFDIIGLSYYPNWHKTPEGQDIDIRQAANYVAALKTKFDKEVMIVETGYPWTTQDAGDRAANVLGSDSQLDIYDNMISPAVQRNFLIELSWLVKESGGLGVVYWEPAWLATDCATYWAQGSHWDNASLFDFEGAPLPGMDFLSYDYRNKPPGLEAFEVTFVVDMTCIDTEQGVFVTGDFDGENQTFLPLTATGDHIYEVTAAIPGRSVGAYAFHNDDNFATSTREPVPAACADFRGTNRQYVVTDQSTTYRFSWGRCDQQPNDFCITATTDSNLTAALYPTISSGTLSLKDPSIIRSIQIIDVRGNEVFATNSITSQLQLSGLNKGLYIAYLVTRSGKAITQKLIIR